MGLLWCKHKLRLTNYFMKRIEKIVLGVVKEHVGNNVHVIMDSNLKDELNFDMLDYTFLAMRLEDEGIHIGFTQLRDCQTVRDIAMLLL